MGIFDIVKKAGQGVSDRLTQNMFDADDWRYATIKEILTDPKNRKTDAEAMTKFDRSKPLKSGKIARMKELLNETGATDAEGSSLKENDIWDQDLEYALSQYIRPQDMNTKITPIEPEKEDSILTAEVPGNPDLLKGETFGEKLLNLSLLYSAGKEKGLPEGGQQSFGQDMLDTLPFQEWEPFKEDMLETSFLYRKGQRDSAKE